MTDLERYDRFLSILRSLPLWILAALAMAGYAALFAPAFGNVDLRSFRNQWGPWFWLDASAFSIFTLARATDLLVRAVNAREKARRRRRRSGIPRGTTIFTYLLRRDIQYFYKHRISIWGRRIRGSISHNKDRTHNRWQVSSLRRQVIRPGRTCRKNPYRITNQRSIPDARGY